MFYYVDDLFALPLEVWRSSYFHNYTRQPSTLELEPGQTKVYESEFSVTALNAGQVPPGDYRAIASFYGWQTSVPMNKAK